MDRSNSATNVLIILAALVAMLVPTIASARQLPPDQALKVRRAVQELFGRDQFRETSNESVGAVTDKFTTVQQILLRRYVAALDEWALASSRARGAAGVRETWWLPGGLEDDFHVLFPGDIITQRVVRPDEVTIGTPRVRNGKVIVTVRDFYRASEGDPPETQTAEIQFEMVSGVWKISEIIYNHSSESRERRLSTFIADQTKKIRELTAKAQHMSSPPEIRKAQPLQRRNTQIDQRRPSKRSNISSNQ